MIRVLPNGRFQADFFRTGAKRVRKNFSDRQQARDWLDLQAITFENELPAPRELSARDLLDAREALALLRASSSPSIGSMPSISLVEAARAYLQEHRSVSKPLREAWEIFYRDRQVARLREHSLIALRFSVLHNLVEQLPNKPVADISPDNLRRILLDSRVGPTSCNNRRRAWITFFEFCRKNRWLRENPAKALTKARVDECSPEIFTPAQMCAWLDHIATHRAEFLPFYGLGFFAGIRTTELERLQWQDIGADHITIPARIAKRRSQRLVPILPPVQRLLAVCPRGRDDAPIMPVKIKARLVWLKQQIAAAKAKKEAGEGAELPAWKSNVMRHSYISYRLAQIQNVHQVSLEAGNSPDIIFKSYRSLVTPKDAELWFNYAPPDATKIVMTPKCKRRPNSAAGGGPIV
ncbi:MAG: hypothetical protein NTY53_25110 [Kiritimatiellaeota bacterium]|nr:hypothetical protein [Kiritimatiellota bacterium]